MTRNRWLIAFYVVAGVIGIVFFLAERLSLEVILAIAALPRLAGAPRVR